MPAFRSPARNPTGRNGVGSGERAAEGRGVPLSRAGLVCSTGLRLQSERRDSTPRRIAINQACAPGSSVQNGFRALPLRGSANARLHSCLKRVICWKGGTTRSPPIDSHATCLIQGLGESPMSAHPTVHPEPSGRSVPQRRTGRAWLLHQQQFKQSSEAQLLDGRDVDLPITPNDRDACWIAAPDSYP